MRGVVVDGEGEVGEVFGLVGIDIQAVHERLLGAGILALFHEHLAGLELDLLVELLVVAGGRHFLLLGEHLVIVLLGDHVRKRFIGIGDPGQQLLGQIHDVAGAGEELVRAVGPGVFEIALLELVEGKRLRGHAEHRVVILVLDRLPLVLQVLLERGKGCLPGPGLFRSRGLDGFERIDLIGQRTQLSAQVLEGLGLLRRLLSRPLPDREGRRDIGLRLVAEDHQVQVVEGIEDETGFVLVKGADDVPAGPRPVDHVQHLGHGCLPGQMVLILVEFGRSYRMERAFPFQKGADLFRDELRLETAVKDQGHEGRSNGIYGHDGRGPLEEHRTGLPGEALQQPVVQEIPALVQELPGAETAHFDEEVARVNVVALPPLLVLPQFYSVDEAFRRQVAPEVIILGHQVQVHDAAVHEEEGPDQVVPGNGKSTGASFFEQIKKYLLKGRRFQVPLEGRRQPRRGGRRLLPELRAEVRRPGLVLDGRRRRRVRRIRCRRGKSGCEHE